jgi:NAD-dependent SIR2 family protein deacetylase
MLVFGYQSTSKYLRMNEKTVYILGAGFSKEASVPSQEELVKKIFDIDRDTPHEFLDDSVKRFRSFLTHTMLIPRRLHDCVPLEDIFTPLDRCIADNVSFRNLSVKDTLPVRDLIYYLVGKTIECTLRSSGRQYIDVFAHHVTERSATRTNHKYPYLDPVSVISTNWDTLLDDAIKSQINQRYPGQAVVDYCCHISSFEAHDPSVMPGLEMLGLGGFSVKLLKLHGSLNWLHCPRCLRLYVDFHNRIAIGQYIRPVNCRYCDTQFGVQKSHRLISNLIMPTFLKNFSNPQYKLIWQSAGIELSEASQIVFIGYSLPQADFEMRQLLARMVRRDARIVVVDYGDPAEHVMAAKMKRYEVFFGRRKPVFHLKGAKDYILNHLGH